jgi:pimeloyl-ACP methyl ester carboxylesterase
LASDLSRGHIVVVPDLRGLGLSSKPPSGFEKKTQAGDVAGVLDDLKIDRAALVTHDIGNMVGYAFASQYPERAIRLAPIDVRIGGPGALKQKLELLATEVQTSSEAQYLALQIFRFPQCCWPFLTTHLRNQVHDASAALLSTPSVRTTAITVDFVRAMSCVGRARGSPRLAFRGAVASSSARWGNSNALRAA